MRLREPPRSVDDHTIPCYPKSSRRRCLSEGAVKRSSSAVRPLRKSSVFAGCGGGGPSRSAGGLTIRSARAAAHEPLRVQFHQQVGLEGSRLDPRILSGRAGPGRVRGALRASGARCAGAGRGRQRASERDRCVLVDAVALFGRAGSAVDGVVRDQRDPEGRSGGACHPDGVGESACRDRRHGDVRRARSQVPDLGAGALPCALGGGAHEGARPEEGSREPEVWSHAQCRNTSPGVRER